MGAKASSPCLPRRDAGGASACEPEAQRKAVPGLEAGSAAPRILLGAHGPEDAMNKRASIVSQDPGHQSEPLEDYMGPAMSEVDGSSPRSSPSSLRSRKVGRRVTFGGQEVATFEVAKMRSIR